MAKKKIGLLPGNSQVATEVALMALLGGSVEVVCFVRSEYGAVLLKLLGIPFAVIDYHNIQGEARKLLAECDLVADFGYPSGQLQDILPAITANARAVMACLRPAARYVY